MNMQSLKPPSYSNNVSLGHLLTIAALVASGMVAFFELKGDVSKLGQSVLALTYRITNLEKEFNLIAPRSVPRHGNMSVPYNESSKFK